MTAFKVVEIVSAERKNGDKGPSLTEVLRLQKPDQEVVTAELWRPGEVPLTTVDQVYEGDVEVDPKWGPKLKLPRPQRPGGFQGGGGGGQRRSDPKERSSIEMQSSIRSAVELTVGLARADKLPADFAETEKLTSAVIGIAKAFHAATQEAGRNAQS